MSYFIIQRRDGTGACIRCENILEVSRCVATLRAVDPSVEAARQYEIIRCCEETNKES
jgi:hypothetical protein